jgi:hypothetical protein
MQEQAHQLSAVVSTFRLADEPHAAPAGRAPARGARAHGAAPALALN